MPPSLQNSFVCDTISCSEIDKIICKLKSKQSSGPDNFNTDFILGFKELLLRPLHYIYNLSINSSTFPTQLKHAKIIPIHKKGDHYTTGNFRPISLLNTFSKIFESIISSRLINFFTKYCILYKFQFGFRQNYSTKLALLDSVDEILGALNDKHYVAAIFFDLAKAFDSIDHNILLSKLLNYGVRGPMHDWFKSYLSGRMQFTSINTQRSNCEPIEYGVPQGSVLGPLLFLIYINDMGLNPKLIFKPKIFADDTNVFASDPNIQQLEKLCQSTIDIISEWLLANRLTLNVDKTCYMIFHPSSAPNMSENLNLTIDKLKITKVSSIKFLGMQIDDKLEWKLHIQDLCQVLRKYVGVFCKLSLKLPANILKMLYFSIIYPRILYGIEIYANTYMINLHDLIILNNRILRILQHKRLSTNINDLYINFKTLPINKLFHFQILTHAQAVYYKSPCLPDIFKLNHALNKDIHGHNTRSSQDFHRVTINSNYSVKISSNLCAKYWNQLPNEIKLLSNLNTYKKCLKNFLFANDII